MGVGVILVAALWLTTLRLVRDTRVSLVPPLRLGKAGSSGTTAVDAWMVSAVAWSTSVGDSDLAAVSGAGYAGGSTPGRIARVSGATEIARWHAGSERTGIATNAALGGSLGGNLTWTAAPSLVIR